MQHGRHALIHAFHFWHCSASTETSPRHDSHIHQHTTTCAGPHHRTNRSGGPNASLIALTRTLCLLPSFTRLRTSLKIGCKATVLQHTSVSPSLLRQASSMVSASSRVTDKGFSMMICLPAAAAFKVASACRKLEGKISTMSAPDSVMALSMESYTLGM